MRMGEWGQSTVVGIGGDGVGVAVLEVYSP